jgi:hypothetical protein
MITNTRTKFSVYHIKAVFISGHAENVFTKGGISDEKVAYIQKPAPPSVMVRTIREVLDE